MMTVNMLQAKTQLSKLVEAVESGAEREVIIARNGKPAARLVPIDPEKPKKRELGFLEGKLPSTTQEDLDSTNDEIYKMFFGEDA
jgi:prevent-host-death family protein